MGIEECSIPQGFNILLMLEIKEFLRMKHTLQR